MVKPNDMKKKTIILLWLVTAYSCSNYSSRLKAVLDYSGTNRAELEKVLDHYSQDPADSLKLKASIFLIENMPGHYTFGGPYMKSYNEQLGLLKNCPYYEKKIIQMVPFDHIGYRQQLDIQEDVKYIKADFLIHQIELAFNQWQTRPWNEGVDFENFKEYLPDQYDKAQAGKIIEKGNYLFLVIAGDSTKGYDREMQRAEQIIDGYFQ